MPSRKNNGYVDKLIFSILTSSFETAEESVNLEKKDSRMCFIYTTEGHMKNVQHGFCCKNTFTKQPDANVATVWWLLLS